MNLLTAASTAQWAMLPDHLETLLDIAARENDVTPEALEAYRSRSLENTQRAKVRENVGIVYLQGPLFKRANLFTEISGATSYETAALDFNAALDNPAVQSISLYLDSPGGEASGCDEFANMIFASRGRKPITAFVSGMAASAAYWIASAADKIIVSDMAVLGSIGVVLSTSDTRARDEKSGVKRYEFVSSQSPNKRPNLDTEDGRTQIQKRVDQLADVFISTVARNRGISAETVIEKFGQGGVEVGAAAVALGMADAVGSFEGVVADLAKRGLRRSTLVNKGAFQMTDKTTGGEVAVDVAKVTADAINSANERAQAIIGHEVSASMPKVANFFAFDKAFASIAGADITRALAVIKESHDASVPAAKEQAEKDAKASAEAAFIASKTAAAGINLPDGGAAKVNPMAAAVAKLNK